MNFIMAIIILVLYLLINSTTFIYNYLSKISGTVNGTEITAKGTLVSGVILCLAYIFLDMLHTNGAF